MSLLALLDNQTTDHIVPNRVMLSALSLECDYGVPVPLMLTGYRKIVQAEGLAGITVRESIVPATGRHGVINRTRFRDSRQIHLTCLLLDQPGGTADRAWQEYYTVARALSCAVDTDRLLRWTAGPYALQSLVRTVEVQAPIEVGPALIRLDVTFRASDPRAYSQTKDTASVAVLGTVTQQQAANLLTNPGAETGDATGWTARSTCTVSSVTEQAAYGSRSFKITRKTDGGGADYVYIKQSHAAAEGDVFSFSAACKAATSGRACRPSLTFRASGGTQLSEATIADTNNASDHWTTREVTNAVAPESTATVDALLIIENVPEGESHYIDGQIVVQGASIPQSAGFLGAPLGAPFGVHASPNTAVVVTNAGSVETTPTLVLAGPMTNPTITLTSPAGDTKQLVFNGDIAAGDELTIDTNARTVLLNGIVDRLNLLDYSTSQWFLLPAGDSTVTLTAESSGTGAGLSVTWRSAFQ